MHTIIQSLNRRRQHPNAEKALAASFRRPSYDCREQPDAVKLIVYVPGVDPAGVEIEANGPDVIITARKAHFVRVNWQALHLEGAQRDYQLRLRLGHGLDYGALEAELHEGVLTVSLPKLDPAGGTARLSRVA